MIKNYYLIFLFLLFANCTEKPEIILKAKKSKNYINFENIENFDVFEYFSPSKITRYENEIKRFEKKDLTNMPPDSSILFVGSSTIRSWYSLEKSFGNLPVINRGFGGSTFPELIYYSERIILKYSPKIIVIYEGDNDQFFMDTKDIMENAYYLENLIHSMLPNSEIYFISTKYSPSRQKKYKTTAFSNFYLKEMTKQKSRTHYINITKGMLNEDTEIIEEYFKPDKLHLTEAGYKAWFDKIYPIISQKYKDLISN